MFIPSLVYSTTLDTCAEWSVRHSISAEQKSTCCCLCLQVCKAYLRMLHKMYGDELVMRPYVMSVDALNAQDTAGTCLWLQSCAQLATRRVCSDLLRHHCCLHMLLGPGLHAAFYMLLSHAAWSEDPCWYYVFKLANSLCHACP